jgi:bifunctional non-homologous end joining protein LigD
MLATAEEDPSDALLGHPRWVFERKYDGMRVLVLIEPGEASSRIRLWSRNGNEKTDQFPDLVKDLRRFARTLRRTVLLDGEVVALDARGQPLGFQHLAGRIHLTGRAPISLQAAATPVALVVFDVLRDGPDDVRGLPLAARRARLEKIVGNAGSTHLRLGDQSAGGDGAFWLRRARDEGWEGLIAKDAESTYLSGKRSPCWRKIKLPHRQEFIVGGWTEPRGLRARFGALVLGYYDEDEAGRRLVHAGTVGSGFSSGEIERVWRLLQARATDRCPFAARPVTPERAHWVEPTLVAEVRFTEWTRDGLLRHPVYLGLRDDVDPAGVGREPSRKEPASGLAMGAPGLAGGRAPGASRTAGARNRTGGDPPGGDREAPGRNSQETPAHPAEHAVRGGEAISGRHRDHAPRLVHEATGAAPAPRDDGRTGRREARMSAGGADPATRVTHTAHTPALEGGASGGAAARSSSRSRSSPAKRAAPRGPATGERPAAPQGRSAAARSADPAPAPRTRRGPAARTPPLEVSPDLETLVETLASLEERRRNATLVLPSGHRLDVTNLAKVYWPGPGITKGELLRYYVRVSPWILPAVAGRPLVMKRFPDGVSGKTFYQQRAPDEVPEGVRVEWTDDEGERLPRLVGGSLLTLLYMTQLGAISQDPWFSRADAPGEAIEAALDLDPMPGVPFGHVRDVARAIGEVLDALGVPAVPKTSGASGLHIYIPLAPGTSYESGQLFCRIVATIVAERHPALASVERAVGRRGRTVYVDYLQNIQGKTLATAYSARASEFAGVSTPLAWAELDTDVRPEDFTLRTVFERFRRVGDLWAPVRAGRRVDLRDVLERLARVRP